MLVWSAGGAQGPCPAGSFGDLAIVVVGLRLKEDEFTAHRVRKKLDGHEGLGAFILREGDTHLVEACLPILPSVGGGDCVVSGQVDLLSFSMQTRDRDRPDRLSG